MLNALLTEITVLLPSKCPISSRNPPNVFLDNSADRHFCRGRFSHANGALFGAISSDKQYDYISLRRPNLPILLQVS